MRYFPFKELVERAEYLEGIILFAILVFLVYTWVKLFLYWDNK
jgi:hypothetical protein